MEVAARGSRSPKASLPVDLQEPGAATADLAGYIDTFYTRTRRHSHLGGLSPEQFEATHKTRGGGLH